MITPIAAPGADIRDWIGRTEEAADVIVPMRVAELQATLDGAAQSFVLGAELPCLHHWMFAAFLGLVPGADLGPDGHPRRGGFLPPVDLPRRMWAASDVTFHAPLHIGEAITRRAEIENVEAKTGRSGALTFVTVRHEYSNSAGLALTDRQSIVYREAPDPAERGKVAPGRPAPADGTFSRKLTPDIAMLFRYSALIFNAHRIHYDLPFATEVEGYPGLVVHGPLIATLLADLLHRERPEARPRRLRFRAMKPMFEGRPMIVAGRESDDGFVLWAADGDNELCAEATVTL